MFSLSASKADLPSLQKAGEGDWQLTHNCRFGPSTTAPALLFSSHQPACRGRWPQYVPMMSSRQGLRSFTFLSAPQPPPLLRIWKPCIQGVAGSPSVVSPSSCLQPHIPTHPCWPTGKECVLAIKPSRLLCNRRHCSGVKTGELFSFRPRSSHLHPKL